MVFGVKFWVKVLKKVFVGEMIIIKILISYKMESGQCKDDDGNVILCFIINWFIVDFNGQNVIDVMFELVILINLYFQFEVVVLELGEFKFIWYDDDGFVYDMIKKIVVS